MCQELQVADLCRFEIQHSLPRVSNHFPWFFKHLGTFFQARNCEDLHVQMLVLLGHRPLYK